MVFAAFVLPDQAVGSGWWVALLRVPIEALLVVAVLLVLPVRARQVTAGVLGAVLGVLTVLRVIDIGFRTVLARAFDPVLDWPLFADGYRFVRDSLGRTGAVLVLAGVLALAVGVPVIMVVAMRRLAAVLARHRTASRRSLLAATLAWVVWR